MRNGFMKRNYNQPEVIVTQISLDSMILAGTNNNTNSFTTEATVVGKRPGGGGRPIHP